VQSKDPTLDEIATLISADPRTTSLTEVDRSALVQRAVEVTYDTAASGEPFVIRGSPGCTNCGGRTVATFTETDEEWGVAGGVMTHQRWNDLSPPERQRLIDEFLAREVDGAYMPTFERRSTAVEAKLDRCPIRSSVLSR